MVASLLHPLNIFIIGLGGGFLIPLLYRFRKDWALPALVLALAAMTLITGVAFLRLLHGAAPIEVLTGGSTPPTSINLRLGVPESIAALSVNLFALLGTFYLVREKYGIILLYLLAVIGVQGMIMTRDLFNLFLFLEIVSIATYGLLSLRQTPEALSATFKYLMATVLASGFFLIGTMLAYAVTGLLNIDDLIAQRSTIIGPLGFAAVIFVLACLLLELKPFPANGWGLDVYETARSDVAAMISGGVSAGVFFALLKLLPLFENQLTLIAAMGAITFVFSNLIGLQQDKAQRLLGYSSIGQMGLLTIAAALLQRQGAESAMLLVIGGLFVNHLFAKVGLFWLAGYVEKEHWRDWSVLAGRPDAILLFGILVVAICGLPPFPGFWAKWQLVLTLAAGGDYAWIAIVLAGSLLEAAYMFRWFGQSVHGAASSRAPALGSAPPFPIYGMAALLAASGCFAATLAGIGSIWVFAPPAAGAVVYGLYRFPARLQCTAVLAIVSTGGIWLIRDQSGLSYLYAVVLLAGAVVVSIACLYRSDRKVGFYPLLAIMLLSLPVLARTATGLEFLFVWELITLSSYFLILYRREAGPHAFSYLLFSLVAAFFLLVGFAVMHASSGSMSLEAFRTAGPDTAPVFVLLAIGLLIKAGAAGVHVWLPGAYAEADDDVSALLSAVISKVAIFGLLIGTYVAIRSDAGLNLALLLGWIGMLTTLVGAMLAVREDDMKRMLAYSSMSQIGYIVAAIALTSHLGWVTALYLVANHLMVKGILFLVAAALILRTGTRLLSDLGGLARAMPLTFAAAAVAIVAMSGLPPLAGFGGKWLLLSAMAQKAWYGPAVMTLLATFVGFLYMARFMQAVFLGPRRSSHQDVTEAPAALLIPQYLLVAGILVMSFFPKLLMEPISKAIDPHFASTLVWAGTSLETIYGYWNPMPVMAISVAIAAILFGLVSLMRRRAGARPPGPGAHARRSASPASFHAFAREMFIKLTPPVANAFFGWMTVATTAMAERSRKLYTGNGQTYNLYILYYLLALYMAGGGLRQLWH
jgi:formate hydrogenlyase subunit 3/multisubunit Na+/H+ antiporter MnhD subunit